MPAPSTYRRSPAPLVAPGAFVVAAGKGGIGVTTAAAVLALTARRSGPVLVLDAQEGLVGVEGVMGIAPADAAPGDADIRVREIASNFTLAHTVDVDATGATTAARRSLFRKAARDATRDAGVPTTLIIDAGSRPMGVVNAVTDFRASLVLVIGPDGVSTAAAYALAKLVWYHCEDARVCALVNRADETAARLAYDALHAAARRFLRRPIDRLGHLPETPGLGDLRMEAWLQLEDHEPTLAEAAAEAIARLAPAVPAQKNHSLTLLR